MRPPIAILLVALVLAPVVSSLTGCKGKATRSTAASSSNYHPEPVPLLPAAFDYYVLNMAWTPAYCAKHPRAFQCQVNRGFTLHGLWPERLDGSMPLNCDNQPGPYRPEDFADIYPDRNELEHEWQKHGTCTGMAAGAYLAFARKAVEMTSFPPLVTMATEPEELETERIVDRLYGVNPRYVPGSLILTCRDHHLQAVEACLTKDLQSIRCGQSIEKTKCTEKTILVTQSQAQNQTTQATQTQTP